ncbi:hypothetical protein FQN54_008627 [Arachnomyces sp. PD_36]|nr:hypothetical protein FQN54_008627 [Arachnomyces sp. PD_36]
MPVPAFGFSVGDFIAATLLIRKVIQGLRDSGGAVEEYQALLRELQHLQLVLKQIQDLPASTTDSQNHYNAVRGMAFEVQLPLRDFLNKMQTSYEELESAGKKKRLDLMRKKIEWAARMEKEVIKMRTIVTMRMVSIHVLLAIPVGESLSRINRQLLAAEATSSTTQIRSNEAIEKILAGQQDIKKSVEMSSCEMGPNIGRLLAISTGISVDVKRLNDNQNRLVQNQQQNITAMQRMTSSIQVLASSFRALVNMFPIILKFSKEVMKSLQLLHGENVEIYTILLRIHQSLSRSPTSQLDDNIRFIDVLNRKHSLPYVYFRYWEVFESMLRCSFEGKPGENKVRRGRYLILDAKLPGEGLSHKDWENLVFPGSEIYMSIILTGAYGTKTQCPRERCLGVARGNNTATDENRLVECDICGLQFVPYSTGEIYSNSSEATSSGTLGPTPVENLDLTRKFLSRMVQPARRAGSNNQVHPPPLTGLYDLADSNATEVVGSSERARHNIGVLCACLKAFMLFRRLAIQLRAREQEELRAFRKVHIRTIIQEAPTTEDDSRTGGIKSETPQSPSSYNSDSASENEIDMLEKPTEWTGALGESYWSEYDRMQRASSRSIGLPKLNERF